MSQPVGVPSGWEETMAALFADTSHLHEAIGHMHTKAEWYGGEHHNWTLSPEDVA